MRPLGALVLVLRRLALLAVLVAIALRVGDVDAPPDDAVPRLDVLVAVDRTTSMAATDDPAGSRLAAVRADVEALGQALPDARFSVVVFGARAETVVPYSTDRDALRDALDAVEPEEPTTGAGSSLGRAVPLLGAVLGGTDRRGRTGEGSEDATVLVVATDGEDTAPGPRTSWAGLDPALDGAAVLGYGTPAGGRMPLVVDGRARGADAFVTDPATGEPALSRLDPSALERVAREVGGRYTARSGGGDIAPVADALQAAAYADLPTLPAPRQVGWVWALVLLALALPELRRAWRGWREAAGEARR